MQRSHAYAVETLGLTHFPQSPSLWYSLGQAETYKVIIGASWIQPLRHGNVNTPAVSQLLDAMHPELWLLQSSRSVLGGMDYFYPQGSKGVQFSWSRVVYT